VSYKWLFTAFVCCLSWAATAQRPIGTWQSHFSYGIATSVASTDNRVYCGTDRALFYTDKTDNTIHKLTKEVGFNDVGIQKLVYHSGQKALVIAYTNSNIDILVNDVDLYNLPDIKNSFIAGSKQINDLAVIGDYVYIASDIGISVLDIPNREIKETYIIGSTGNSVPINSITSDGTTIFAGTSEGLKSAPLNSPNLLDYKQWRSYGLADSLPNKSVQFVAQRAGQLYLTVGLTMYTSTGGSFTTLRTDTVELADTPRYFTSFKLTGDTIYGTMFVKNSIYDWGKLVVVMPNNTTLQRFLPTMGRPVDIISDRGTVWIADQWNSLLKYSSGASAPELLHPIGTASNSVHKMSGGEEKLYMVAGEAGDGFYETKYIGDGPIVYTDGQWKNYASNKYPVISKCVDMVDVAVDESRHKAYYISHQDGVVELDLQNEALVHYDNANSPLERNGDQIRASAACIDGRGNLWVAVAYVTNKLYVKTPDGDWKSFFITGLPDVVRTMVADQYGSIWMGGYSGKLSVYNPGDDVLSTADDQYKVLDNGVGTGAIFNTTIWSIVMDKNGDIWVGTDQGIAVYFCTGSVFNAGGCDAERIKVNQDGFIGYLFGTEVVRAIAVDGANRKWVGTLNGVWLISEDGKTQLQHFTKDNSPLPSNFIQTIGVVTKTGEVFFGTEKGTISYQGDAIIGDAVAGKATVYPNPVSTHYTGPIAIKGLVDDAYVKITDVSGTLVYQGKANGGQMVWNGNGYNGTRVSTGVYIVYAATALGKEHSVAKIHFEH
jgi:Two component regulator propeller